MSGMQGYNMRFPVIKVRDKSDDRTHIVGSDSHDSLYVDGKSGIHYYNLQCGEGTKGDFEFITEDEYGVGGDFCVGSKNECGQIQIEFVTFDELFEIYKQQVKVDIKMEDKIMKSFKKWQRKKKRAEKRGIFHT